jgi:hypothetical protein
MSVLVGNTIRRNDSVFIAAYWPLKNEIETTNAVQMVTAIAQTANKLGAEVIVEAPLPSFNKSAFFCTKEWYRTNYEGCTVDRTTVEQQRANFMAQIQELIRTQHNVRIWDPLPILCPTTTCSQFQGESPLFLIMEHDRLDLLLSRSGSMRHPIQLKAWPHSSVHPNLIRAVQYYKEGVRTILKAVCGPQRGK